MTAKLLFVVEDSRATRLARRAARQRRLPPVLRAYFAHVLRSAVAKLLRPRLRPRRTAGPAPADHAAAAGDGRATPAFRSLRVAEPDSGPQAAPAREPAFPVDVVYTWVDGADPIWRARCRRTLRSARGHPVSAQAVQPARFRNRDELRYSLRSLARHAQFVRRVYVVTAGQVPEWLNQECPGLHVVPHEEILDADCLPTYNSHAIESGLHRIDGLAEHYLYLNDDFFFGRDCGASSFFTPDGRTKLFPDPRAIVPPGASSPADRPVDSASKNTRDLLLAELDMAITYKIQHVPYPQRRSVLYEMEDRFPWVFKETGRNPFRHHTDVNIASCLSHYYALATGAGAQGAVAAMYANVGSPWAPLQMRRLLARRDRDVFCLNEGALSCRPRTAVDSAVRAFLEAYFPTASPFERGQ